MSWWTAVPFILLAVKLLLVVVTLTFFVSGVDDGFIDLCFLALAARDRLVPSALRSVDVDALRATPEQPIAIMIAAWHEADVIRAMLHSAVERLEYGAYHIFVGTYPNDPDTHREVDAVAAEVPHVHRVVTPRPGPTCKADCLNAIYAAIRDFEVQAGVRFAMYVLQDAEDVLHPQQLRLFNRLIPDYDMVQIPVLPLTRGAMALTCGHYVDEFAESHYKNMRVRAAMHGGVPSAGVGTAFSRAAMAMLETYADVGEVFNTASVTEDYELGVKLRRAGARQLFAWVELPPQPGSDAWDPIVVREFFPARFSAAVRQKSRWMVGITLQAWKNLGWSGIAIIDYMLARDRKNLWTSLTNVLGYVSLASVTLVFLAETFVPDAYRYPPLIRSGTWLYRLIIADTGFLAWRLAARAGCVYRLYGMEQALLSLPRQLWGNFVNFGAAVRAARTYVTAAITGRRIAWAKTDHAFPIAPGASGADVAA